MPAGVRTAGRGGRSAFATGPADRIFKRLLMPALIVYVVTFLGPAVYGLSISFDKWAGPGSAKTSVGFRNYLRIFRDAGARQAFTNTVLLVVFGGVGVFALAFCAMAVLRDMRGRALVRAVLYVPAIISMIAIGTSLGFLLNPDGLVNRLLGALGLHALQRPWLDPGHVFGCIIVGMVWLSCGFYILLLMTAVDSIPKHLYEEAKLAGLTRVQEFRHITFPLTRDMVTIAAVLWTTAALRTFDIVIGFVGGAAGDPPQAARTYAVEQYYTMAPSAGAPEMGYGSAMAVLLTLLTIVLVTGVRRLGRSERLELS